MSAGLPPDKHGRRSAQANSPGEHLPARALGSSGADLGLGPLADSPSLSIHSI